MNSSYNRPIVSALNGGINAGERMLRIIFPAFSSRKFGCVCFCVIVRRKNTVFLRCGASLQMHSTDRLTQNTNTSICCVMPVSAVFSVQVGEALGVLESTGCRTSVMCSSLLTRSRSTRRCDTMRHIERTSWAGYQEVAVVVLLLRNSCRGL